MALAAELYELLMSRPRGGSTRFLSALKSDAANSAGAPVPDDPANKLIEDFELPNAIGTPVRLSTLLKSGPLAVLIYRGCWSDLDRQRLKALDAMGPMLEIFGARCATMTPIVPVRCLSAAERAHISLEMISDVGAVVRRRFAGIAVAQPACLWALRRLGVDVPRVYGVERPAIPTPCLMAISEDAHIIFHHSFSSRENDEKPIRTDENSVAKTSKSGE